MLNIIPSVKPLSVTQQTATQKIASKIGQYIPDKISHTFEMNKMGALDRIPLFLLSLVFVLGARFYKSRDNNERREVLTRDTASIVATMLTVPSLKKWMEKGINKITKIPTVTEDYGLDNIKNWYSKAEFMPEKALSVAKNIKDRGGDVKKAFSTLGEEASKHITTLLQGKEHNAENILKSLEEGINSSNENIKNAFNSLTKILSDEKNGLAEYAQRIKAIPAITSLVFITLLLGWGIPAINIRITRNRLKNGTKNNNTTKTPSEILEPKLNDTQKQIISSFFVKNQN